MRRRLRNLIIAMTAAGCLAVAGTGAAAASTAPGTVSVFAGGGSYVVSSSGLKPTDAFFSSFNGFSGVTSDSAGDVAIADYERNVIDLMPGSNCTTACPFGLADMQNGYLYALAGGGTTTPTVAGVPMAKASLGEPVGLRFDAAGDLIITDSYPAMVLLVSARDCSQNCPYGLSSLRKGYVYLVAGGGSTNGSGLTQSVFTGISARQAALNSPREPALDSRQDIVFSNPMGYVVDLVAASSCSSNCPYGLSSLVAGDIYTIAGNGTNADSGDGGPATSAELYQPQGVSIDNAGNILIADSGNGKVRFVASENCSGNCAYGTSSTQKGYIYYLLPTNSPAGVSADPAGDVLVSNSLTGTVQILAGTNCSADCPYGLSSMQANHVYTLTSSLTSPAQLGLSGAGTLYVADGAYSSSGQAFVHQIVGGAALFKLAVAGTGSLTGGGTTCHTACTTVHAAGTRMKLTATAGTGRLFAGWMKGTGCRGTGVCNAYIEQGKTAKAVFRTRKYLAKRLRSVLNHVSGKNMAPKRIWRHKGYTVRFKAAAARKMVIAWRIRRHHHSVLVAIGHRVPAQVGVHAHLKIKLTKAGRRLLSASRAFRGTEIAHLYLGKNHKAIKLKRKIKV